MEYSQSDKEFMKISLDWHPSSTTMVPLADGRWAKKLTLPPGRYEYRFVVDGQWMDDPAAKETVLNPFGGGNAVVVVEGEPPAQRPT